jgi:hypothetical protein
MTTSGRPSDHAVFWSARRTIDMHVREDTDARLTGRCARCRADGCDLLAWATALLRAAASRDPTP